MPRDNEHNPDPNANAARIVRESARIGPQKQPSSVARNEAQASTPAVAAGIAGEALTILDLVMMVEADEAKLGERLSVYLPAKKG